MASNGLLEFQGTNKATFVGTNSNIVLDTVTSSLGIGVDVDGPTSNLHVVGNAYVSTELTVTGNAYVSSNLEVTGNTTFTGNLIKTNGYTQIHDKTRLLNGEASFYDADNVLRTGRRTILEINVNAPTSSNTAQREYTGYIDIEMISQRTVAGYNTSSGGYVGRLNFVMSYTTYPSSIWEYGFTQEVKAYNPGTGANGMVGNAPILRYKLDNATKKLQFFLEFTYQRIEAHFTWAVRMSCDSLDDVSIPSPDSEMSQGTLTTAPIGVSYNETGNVGIGTVSPGAMLEIYSPLTNTAIFTIKGRRTGESDVFETNFVQKGASGDRSLQQQCTPHSTASDEIHQWLYWNSANSGWLYPMILRGNGDLIITGSLNPSDDRLKTNEVFLENATETLMKLKPQKYDKHSFSFLEISPEEYSNVVDGNVFIESVNKCFDVNDFKYSPSENIWYKRTLSDDTREEAGLIAQDIWYDTPELRYIVSVPEDAQIPETKPETSDDPTIDPDYENWGRKNANVNYTHLIPYLIKSNQELYIKNDALETQLTSVLTRLDALENA